MEESARNEAILSNHGKAKKDQHFLIMEESARNEAILSYHGKAKKDPHFLMNQPEMKPYSLIMEKHKKSHTF
jgi:hypothetical protein